MELALLDQASMKKELWFTFTVAVDRIEQDTIVDLSAFETTGFELDGLVVEVLGICCESLLGWDEAQYCEELRVKIEEEVGIVGEALVGKGCRAVFTREMDERLAHDVFGGLRSLKAEEIAVRRAE